MSQKKTKASLKTTQGEHGWTKGRGWEGRIESVSLNNSRAKQTQAWCGRLEREYCKKKSRLNRAPACVVGDAAWLEGRCDTRMVRGPLDRNDDGKSSLKLCLFK